MKKKSEILAIKGGKPVWNGIWPKWPEITEKEISKVIEVMKSERWAISGPSLGKISWEKKFSIAFAKYCGVNYCVPTCNGTSALLIALEALNIGYGDEVVVPILTWVATATAVTNINAIPVFVDVDPKTLCVSPEAINSVITPNTKAIIPVHLYSGMANMDKLSKISSQYEIPIIEDCSHVHGALWNESPAGSFGKIGTFSMQQTKVLTAGEGGAAVTDEKSLANYMEQLRADGRIYKKKTNILGEMDIVKIGDFQGNNYCLTEYQAALLYEKLKTLDLQHEKRRKNAKILDRMLLEIDGIKPLSTYSSVKKRVYYHYVFKINSKKIENKSIEVICGLLTSELGILIEPIYKPLHQNIIYNPLSKKRFHINKGHIKKLKTQGLNFPNAEKAYNSFISLPHKALLGNYEHLQAIADAIIKVLENISNL